MIVNELGGDVNTRNNSGSTSLHYAAEHDNGKALRLLVTELGADVNAKDSKGRTALDIATKHDNPFASPCAGRGARRQKAAVLPAIRPPTHMSLFTSPHLKQGITREPIGMVPPTNSILLTQRRGRIDPNTSCVSKKFSSGFWSCRSQFPKNFRKFTAKFQNPIFLSPPPSIFEIAGSTLLAARLSTSPLRMATSSWYAYWSANLGPPLIPRTRLV